MRSERPGDGAATSIDRGCLDGTVVDARATRHRDHYPTCYGSMSVCRASGPASGTPFCGEERGEPHRSLMLIEATLFEVLVSGVSVRTRTSLRTCPLVLPLTATMVVVVVAPPASVPIGQVTC